MNFSSLITNLSSGQLFIICIFLLFSFYFIFNFIIKIYEISNDEIEKSETLSDILRAINELDSIDIEPNKCRLMEIAIAKYFEREYNETEDI